MNSPRSKQGFKLLKAAVFLSVISIIKSQGSVTSGVRLPIPVHEQGFVLAPSLQCPTTRCHCQQDVRTSRYIINCRYQKLEEIPTFTAVDTVFYEITFSSNNYITQIPTNAFRNLKVERIDLLKNSLVTIFPGAFAGLEEYLKELLIEGNGNIPPPYTKISNLVKLRTLRLQKFQEYTIEQNNFFDMFPELEVLELYNFVSLTAIDGLAFQNRLPKLRKLEIIDSHLTNIPVQSLIQLTALQELNIRDSQITTVYSKSFEQLHNLTQLDLSYNKITTLEKDAFQGIEDQLESLSLTFNELTPESTEAVSGKTWLKLQQLTLSYNTKLGSMPDMSFKTIPTLQYLNLVQINLRKVSKDFFAGLKNLHTLDLSWNKIETIEANAFSHMPNLHELKLNRQFGQTEVPPDHAMQMSELAFHAMEKSLAVLDLQDTPIVPEQIWNIVKTLTSLQTLRLSRTRLSEIPDLGFVYNVKLEEIELEGNGIATLTSNTFTGPNDSLKRVLLNSNKLSSVSYCVFDKHTKLEAICLAQNPLYCNCSLFWLYNFISRPNAPIGPCFQFDYICSAPKQYENQALFTVPFNETCYSYIPRDCVYQIPTTTSKAEHLSTANMEDTTTAMNANEMAVTIIGKTTTSISVAWNIQDKTGLTGFTIEYHVVANNLVTKINIESDIFQYTLQNLRPGLFYTVCISPIRNHAEDNIINRLLVCKTAQTNKETEIVLTIGGKTVDSITIAWSVQDKSEVTGFILEYHATTDNLNMKENIHRDQFLYTIHNLNPGQFYTMCIYAEINQVKNDNIKACRTAQTLSKGTDADEQSDKKNNDETEDINARNVLIGAVLGTVVVIILVITGLYLVVKYKVQKLKTLRLTLDQLQHNTDSNLGRRAEDIASGKVCTVSNEYIEMEEMKKAAQYQTIGGRHFQRLYGPDTNDVNNDNAIEDIEEVKRDLSDSKDRDNDTYGYSKVSRSNLTERHSAPSTLSAGDLLRRRSITCASRPLPATPNAKEAERSLPDILPATAANVITTQVSVYENRGKDTVYHELP